MPRHQDNVDAVLTTTPRPGGPPPPAPPNFSGRYALDVPENDPDATWGERTDLNGKTRLFRCQHSSGDVNIQAIISSLRTLEVAVDTPFGTLTTVSFSVPAGSKFTWESVDGHRVTLELAGTLAAAPLEFVCRDETPSEDLWHIDAKANVTTERTVETSSGSISVQRRY